MGYAYSEKDGGWRWAYGWTVPLSIVLFVGAQSLPPSARWLALRGKNVEAVASLAFVYPNDDARDAAADRTRARRQGRTRERPVAQQRHTIQSGRRGDAAHRVRSRSRGASRRAQRRSRGSREDHAVRCHHAELVRESLDAIGYVVAPTFWGTRDGDRKKALKP